MTSQPVKENNEIWSDNRTQHENIFLEELYRKLGGETIPKFFSEKPKMNTSLDL